MKLEDLIKVLKKHKVGITAHGRWFAIHDADGGMQVFECMEVSPEKGENLGQE